MSKYSKKQLITIIKQLKKNNPDTKITRGFYRQNTVVPDSAWEKFFGTFSEYLKSGGLTPTRGQSKILRDTARMESLDHFRDYLEAEVLP